MPPKYPSVSPSIGPAGAEAGQFICGLRQERRAKKSPASRRQGQGDYSADITGEDPAARRRGKNSLTSAGKKRAQPQCQLEGSPKHSSN